MSTETLYLRADEIKPGDRLPDVSRFPVSVAAKHARHGVPYEVVFSFDGTGFTRAARHGGPGYGFECFRVERGESEEDYALVCDAMHAANPHRFEGEL